MVTEKTIKVICPTSLETGIQTQLPVFVDMERSREGVSVEYYQDGEGES